MSKLITKSEIIDKLNKEFGAENVKEINTKDYDLTSNPKNPVNERCTWADKTVEELYNMKRENIIKEHKGNSKGEYCFAYIKLAIDGKETYGIVSGKSCFHKKYASDVWFYDERKTGSHRVLDFMKHNKLTWDEDSIIIIKNIKPIDSKEAYDKEKKIKEMFNLFD